MPAGRALAGTAALVALLSLGERLFWLGQLADELALHAGLMALLGAVLLGVGRRWLELPAALVAAAYLLWPSVAIHAPRHATPGPGPVLTVVGLVDAQPTAAVERWLAGLEPDVVGVARGRIPQLVGHTRRSHDGGSLGLSTRLPLEGKPFGRAGVLAVRARLHGCAVQLGVFDLPSVWRAEARSERAERLRAFRRLTLRKPAIYMGHAGSQLDTGAAARLARQAKLRDTRLGFGRLASWPSAWGPLGFAVDHILVRGWVGVVERDVGPALPGLGHRPVVAKLRVTDRACR